MGKLTDLEENIGLAPEDVIHVVSVGDTTQDVAGSSFKVTLQTVFDFFKSLLSAEDVAFTPVDGVEAENVQDAIAELAAVVSDIETGGSLQKETPTGAIDNINVIFGVDNEPYYINVNGAIYEEGDGEYLSYIAGDITLANPVGTGGFIKSYFI